MAAARRTQSQRVEESTTRLLQAAAELIADGGYDAASAAEISRRAGYSRSMVHVRFGSKEGLVDAVVASAFEGPLTAEIPEGATGLERVLARLDTVAALASKTPELLRTIFAIEFQAAAGGSRMGTRVARFVTHLRAETLDAVLAGQRDGSIRPDLVAEPTAHAIVAEGIGAAFMWIVDPSEDFRARVDQWRARTRERLV